MRFGVSQERPFLHAVAGNYIVVITKTLTAEENPFWTAQLFHHHSPLRSNGGATIPL
jgi:hypothetical protein